MELIERYIYAVIRHLPAKQRADIEKELRSLIEDMLQQRTGDQPPRSEDIEAVLLELGEPGKLADNYRGTARCLISPRYFDTYWLILRIALLASGFGILVATAVNLAVNPENLSWQTLADLLSGIFNALIGAFGIVTLIFALNERFNQQAPEAGKAAAPKWQPSQLPARPASGLLIKWGDPIAAIVFSVIFLVIINLNLNLIGLYMADDEGLRIVPLLSDYFRQFIPWINLSLALAILIEGVKLFTGRWTIPLVIGSLAQKTLSLVISLQLFADARLFSADFVSEMQSIFSTADKILAADFAMQTCRVLRIIAIAGFVIDVLTLGWKSIRIAMVKADKPIKFTEE